jgi:hypothetical protein
MNSPICFIQPESGFVVMESNPCVKPDGSIYLRYLHGWTANDSTLVDLFHILVCCNLCYFFPFILYHGRETNANLIWLLTCLLFLKKNNRIQFSGNFPHIILCLLKMQRFYVITPWINKVCLCTRHHRYWNHLNLYRKKLPKIVITLYCNNRKQISNIWKFQ